MDTKKDKLVFLLLLFLCFNSIEEHDLANDFSARFDGPTAPMGLGRQPVTNSGRRGGSYLKGAPRWSPTLFRSKLRTSLASISRTRRLNILEGTPFKNRKVLSFNIIILKMILLSRKIIPINYNIVSSNLDQQKSPTF